MLVRKGKRDRYIITWAVMEGKKFVVREMKDCWNYISFVDDKYRYTDIDFLKERSDGFASVKVCVFPLKN